jgi:hypothetical protein
MRYVLQLTTCFALALGWISWAAAADASAQRGSLLITTESRLEGAALVSTSEDFDWKFKASDENLRSFAASKVVRWGSFATAVGGHRVRLVSGGELVGHTVEVRAGEVSVDSTLLEAVRLPRGSASAIVFDLPTDQQSAQTVAKRITAAAGDADTLLFANGDQLTGQIVELARDKLTFKSAAADVVVDRARVAAIVFRRGKATDNRAKDGLRIWTGLRDGSRVLARNVYVVGNDKSASLDLVAGGAVSVPPDAIVALQPIGGGAMYLSDLNDAGYRHIPFLALAWDVHRDRNVTGGPLTADGRHYLKGLGMHSAARITYNLDGEYRSFQSELAIDDSTDGRGSVTCRVFTDDGSGRWRLKYESPVVRGGEKPVPVNVDLAGAKRLSLLVDFADRGDEQDHLNWLDARLIRD